jgi:succinate dehydrogenase / fumarate reductase cytochrome b subunit
MPKVTIQRKWFALSGVVPLGAFLVVHLVMTASGLAGGARFGRVFAHRAWVTAAIALLVLVPLAFHAGYGAYLAAARGGDASLPSWRPRLRRAAALGTLAFVVAHLVELPGPVWTGGIEEGALFDRVGAHLSSTWHGVPFVAVLYLAGVAATLAHFGLELWVFFPAMGITLAAGGQKALAWGIAATASLLFLLAGDTIVYFATGARLLAPSPAPFVPEGPPPVACSPNGGTSPR